MFGLGLVLSCVGVGYGTKLAWALLCWQWLSSCWLTLSSSHNVRNDSNVQLLENTITLLDDIDNKPSFGKPVLQFSFDVFQLVYSFLSFS